MTQLYLEHFGLDEAPFSITPNPHFFFAGSNRGSLLDALKFSVQSDEGIVTVIGEVGSGKTMLCRMLLDDLPPQVDAIYLANPSFSANEILDAIAHDLGLGADASSAMTRLDALNRELIARYGAGRRVVLLIDEAHAMPPESLEEVRLLSNLETSRHKLLSIVLFGQPELTGVLARPTMRQLRERVVQRFELGPLRRDELRDYLAFRLRAAGHRDNFPFSKAAVDRIGRTSRGLTRRINILGDKALLSAFARNARAVELDDVTRAERDVGFSATSAATASMSGRRRIAIAAVATLAAGAAFAAGMVVARAGDATRARPAATQVQPPVSTPAPASVRADAAPRASASPPAIAVAPTPQHDALARAERAFDGWRRGDVRGYTIQVAAFADTGDGAARDAVDRIARSVEPHPVAVAREPGRRPRVLVFVGEFDSASDARRAIDALPAPLRANQPVLRSLDDLPHSASRT